MPAIGSLRKKLPVFNDDGEDDYGSGGMYFNPSMFPPHRPEKEVKVHTVYSLWDFLGMIIIIVICLLLTYSIALSNIWLFTILELSYV